MLNSITLQGRLTADPTLRTTQSQTPVASFTLACDRDFGDKKTDFFSCSAWRGTAEFINRNFRKGQLVVVSGRLQNNEWRDKDGNKRINADIVVENAYFCEKKAQGPDVQVEEEEVLPF